VTTQRLYWVALLHRPSAHRAFSLATVGQLFSEQTSYSSSPFSKLTHLAWPRNLSCSSNATFRRETDQ